MTAPARVFNMPTSIARRNQAQAAQPTRVVNERTRRRRFIVENYSRGKYSGLVIPHCVTKCHLYSRKGEFAVKSVLRRNLGTTVDELMTSATVLRLRRWQWTSICAAPRRCYVEAALRSRRLKRRTENLGATIVTVTQQQWIRWTNVTRQ